MPQIGDLLDRLGGARFLSSLDLTKGYWQIPLRPEDKEKTAFSTPKGLYQFTHMPFGLHGAAATFQRLMDYILDPVRDCAAAYIDDIIVFSSSWEEHLVHLQRVLSVLRAAGLTVNPAKCKVGVEKVKFLGFYVGKGEIQPLEEKVTKISDWPKPATKREVQQFLGLAGYYRQFIPAYATIAAPLTDFTRKKAPRKVRWSMEAEKAFQELKEKLCELPKRYTPDFSKPFILFTDASDRGLGAVLAQERGGQEYPVLYLSRKLNERERKFAVIEKEALAIRWATAALRYYLLGTSFVLVTDHAPLKWLQQMKDTNPRLTRWYLALQPFAFTVQHRKGTEHANVDYFSRQGPWVMTDEEPTALLEGGVCDKGDGGPSAPIGKDPVIPSSRVTSQEDPGRRGNTEEKDMGGLGHEGVKIVEELARVNLAGKGREGIGEREKGEGDKRELQEVARGVVTRVEKIRVLPEGWEHVWMENPDTGIWERMMMPAAEARAYRERANRVGCSYWGERETREWRRKIREEREKIEKERRLVLATPAEPKKRISPIGRGLRPDPTRAQRPGRGNNPSCGPQTQ